MALEGVWDKISTWETSSTSILRMNIVNIPDGEYVFYILDLDNTRMTQITTTFENEISNVTLNTVKGTRLTYQTIKTDTPVVIGINYGVTE